MFIDEIHVKPGKGQNCRPSQMTKCYGKDWIISAAPGTVLFDSLTGELIADIRLIGVPDAGKSNEGCVSDAAIEPAASVTYWQG
jgi:GTPase involved in cell partitioning and DNA repair